MSIKPSVKEKSDAEIFVDKMRAFKRAVDGPNTRLIMDEAMELILKMDSHIETLRELKDLYHEDIVKQRSKIAELEAAR